jgi:hypothetical protein
MAGAVDQAIENSEKIEEICQYLASLRIWLENISGTLKSLENLSRKGLQVRYITLDIPRNSLAEELSILDKSGIHLRTILRVGDETVECLLSRAESKEAKTKPTEPEGDKPNV